MLDNIKLFVESCTADFSRIPPERKEILLQLADCISHQLTDRKEVKLVFICTHNSRRSHIGQLWASAASTYYCITNISTYSGGTEATAFNPRAVAALKRCGFLIQTLSGGENPQYQVTYSLNEPPLLAFSKKYDDPANPTKDFAAVMTCTQADHDCPLMTGANFRLSLPYDDPKSADGTTKEIDVYNKRNHQIASELLYCFSLIQY